MIIDLTGVLLETSTDDSDFDIDDQREAWHEWRAYVDGLKKGLTYRDCPEDEWLQTFTAIIETALKDVHMRDLLVRATCRRIHSRVVKIVEWLNDGGQGSAPVDSTMHRAPLAAVEIAILDRDNHERFTGLK